MVTLLELSQNIGFFPLIFKHGFWQDHGIAIRERNFFNGEGLTGKQTRTIISPATATAKSLQSCPTLCDPTDGSPPGSPIPGILQARTLEYTLPTENNILFNKKSQ